MAEWQERNLREHKWPSDWAGTPPARFAERELDYDLYTYGVDTDKILEIAEKAKIPLEVLVDYLTETRTKEMA